MNPDIETEAALAIHRALYRGEKHWDDAKRVNQDLPALYEAQARRIARAVLDAVRVDIERTAHRSGWTLHHIQQRLAEKDPTYKPEYEDPWESA